MPRELRIPDLARLLNICPQAIHSYIRKGYFPAYKQGSHRYIYLDDYAQFLCDRPRFRRRFLTVWDEIDQDDPLYEIAQEIRQYIDTHSIVFAPMDIAIICDVTSPAIFKWIAKGELRKDVNNKFCSREEVKRFFEAHPLITRHQKVDI